MAILLVGAYRVVIERLLAGHAAVGLGDVRPTHGFVIRATAAESPSINRLAEMLGTSKQAASKLADSMVQQGYLRRYHDATDRRLIRLRLTVKGERVRQTALKTSAAIERELGRQVGARQVRALRQVLVALLGKHGALDEALAHRAQPVW